MTLAPDKQLELVRVIEDPVLFGHGVLGHNYWATQQAILRSVAKNRQTAVKACHASSKTHSAAAAVLWWLTRYQDAKVITTAPTWLQVRALLWGEIRRAVATSRIQYPEPNLTELRLSDNRYAIGLSTDEPTRFQGFHGGHILIVLDEAPGVRGEIWEAMQGIRAGGDVRVLAIGNPTETGNPFHQIFGSMIVGWERFTISAFDTPNFDGVTVEQIDKRLELDPDMASDWWDDNPWPMLVTRRWVGEAYRNWGEDHPAWRSRVLGEFPEDDSRAVIPYSWVQAAFIRWRERYEGKDIPEPNRIGMDIGSGEPGSDKTVFAKRRNMDIVGIEKSGSLRPMEGVNKLSAMLANSRMSAIVDWSHMGIASADRLRETGIPYERFVASGGTQMRDKTGVYGFTNIRSASWWNMRELLDPDGGADIALFPDEELAAELSAPSWREVTGAKIQVEQKIDIKKRIGRSTDTADAVIMAYWGSSGGGGGRSKKSVWDDAGVGVARRSEHRGVSRWAV